MTHLTLEEFRKIHDDWKNSGLSIQQFCESIGIRESRFYYWSAKLKSESLPATCGSFIPVKMGRRVTTNIPGGQGNSQALCEVAYPNGVVVRVTSDMTLEQLRQMITLLR